MLNQWIGEDGNDVVFLATEDRDVYQKMHHHYGKKLRAISQERFAVEEFKDVMLISELEKEKNTEKEYDGANATA